MNARWLFRILGVVMLLLFLVIFSNMHRQLKALQQQQQQTQTGR